MNKKYQKNIYLRYKFQSEILDLLATKQKPFKTTDIPNHIPHFKKCNVNQKEFHTMYQELKFLENIGLCTICDNEGKIIQSDDDFIKVRFERHQPICSMLTTHGIEAVQSRTYESLYISTYLNYRMYKLSMISICCALMSIFIACFQSDLKLFIVCLKSLFE